MSAILAIVPRQGGGGGPEESSVLEGAVTTITEFAGTYGPQVLVVMGVAVGIGLGIWGFIKLVGLFRRTAK